MASVGKKQRPILRLLPSVCRDCGRSEEAEPLSDYLDFRLCGACVARRERELMRGPAAKREGDRPAGDRASPKSSGAAAEARTAAGSDRRKERGPQRTAPKGKTGRKPAPSGGKGSRGKKKR